MASRDPQRELEYEGAQAAFDFAIWSLGDQVRTIETTDAKSGRALTLGVAIAALFSGAITFQLDDAGETEAIAAGVAGGLVALCFIATIGFFFHSYAATNWYLGPQSENLLMISAEHSDLRTRQWLAERIFASIEHNATQIEAKTARSTRLFWAVSAQAVAASLGVAAVAIASAAS